MGKNPFPGPQPYRAEDRDHFYGRDALAERLANNVIANRCITVFGPSGAGKSSILQAAVLPMLIARHEVRVVRVDSWPEDTRPARWLAGAIHGVLDLGPLPSGLDDTQTVRVAAQRAARRSSRLLVVHLDQLEQLLYPSRSLEQADALFASVDELVELPLRNIRVVLSLREDYLGRFRDRAQDRGRLLDHGFRIKPLTVAELGDAVCKAAAGGDPPQVWDPEEVHDLMLQVRVPGQAPRADADAQAAYAQIVCRALFQSRERGDVPGDEKDRHAIDAEGILRQYLDATLTELGPLRESAQRVLEDHLVTSDGSRTLRTEKELRRLLPEAELSVILPALENAAILRAEQHQGSRYFELGHDWLARKLHAQRKEREIVEERNRVEQEQREALRKKEEETERELAKERRHRRRLVAVAIASVIVAAAMGAIGLWALAQKQLADESRCVAKSEQRKAERQKQEAEERRREAHDAQILAGFRELSTRGQAPSALKLLLEVEHPRPSELRGYTELASAVLDMPTERAILRGHSRSIGAAKWSPDGQTILTTSADGTALLHRADGTGMPMALKGHEKAVLRGAFSPDGKRVLTVSEDRTGRVWSAEREQPPVVLAGHEEAVLDGLWSPDGQKILLVSADQTASVWSADGKTRLFVLRGHEGAISQGAWSPDSQRVVTASEDKTARVWSAQSEGDPVVLKGHKSPVTAAIFLPGGERVVTASEDKTARIWAADGKGSAVELLGHEGSVYDVAASADGAHVATASVDGSVRVWDVRGPEKPLVLLGHLRAALAVAFRPDGHYLASASADMTTRIWSVEGGNALAILRGHRAPVGAVSWSPEGKRLLTAVYDPTGLSVDQTARVWGMERLPKIAPRQQGERIPHAAALGASSDYVTVAHEEGRSALWHLHQGAEPESVTQSGVKGWIASVAMDKESRRIVAAYFDGRARIFGLEGAEKPIELLGHEQGVRAAAFSPDGTRVVTTSEDRTARIYSARDGASLATLRGHSDWLCGAAFSPDGTRVVTTSLDGTARIYQADGQGEPIVLTGHQGGVLAAAFSPDGKRVATVSEDRTLRIWQADGKAAPLVLVGHENAVLLVAYSADGEHVATASSDGTLRVWSLSGQHESIVMDTAEPVLALSFEQGGKHLVALDQSGTLHTYTLDAERLKRDLVEASTECLSPDVRVKYLGEAEALARARHAECERGYHRMEAP